MLHEEYVHIVPGAKTAVLFLHGICGTPNHFRQVLPLEAAVPKEWSVYNILLDGHCKNVEDFGRSSMKKWKAQVENVFTQLSETHEKVVLVGHSMGTLFSIQLALQHPQKVPFLFLLAVPVRVAVQPRAVRYLLRIAFDRIDAYDPVLVAMHNACGITQTKKLWKYIPWAPRMVELLRECRATGRCLSKLQVPCVALQSAQDEMVSRNAGKLLQESGRVTVVDLPNSTHFYYEPEDLCTVQGLFTDACKQYV